MPTRFALLLLACCLALPAIAAPPRTFSEAKKIAWQLYAQQSVEFYCGCRYSGNRVDLKSCGYQPRKNPQRAARIEWEHLVPAWVIGHQRRCWQQGGRKHCARSDETFRRAEADLFNLVPSIGELNGDRSNLPFAWLPQQPSQYGACPMVVDFQARKAMPRPKVRGMIATWEGLKGKVDARRWNEVRMYLDIQLDEAIWWRDASIAYFQSVSKRPLPAGHNPPAHDLDWYKAIQTPYAPGRG